MQGFKVVEGFKKNTPDLQVYDIKGNLIKIVSVKAFNLSRTHQDGLAHSRTIYRKDILPEIEASLYCKVSLDLLIMNLRNQKRITLNLDASTFDQITTPLELADDLT